MLHKTTMHNIMHTSSSNTLNYYNACYTKLQGNHTSYYIKSQSYYITLHYIPFLLLSNSVKATYFEYARLNRLLLMC